MTDFGIFVLGISAGILVAFGSDVLRYYFLRPRLFIAEDRPETADGYSVHSLVIRNKGRRVARNTQGFVSFEDLSPADLVPESEFKLVHDLDLDPAKFGIESIETVYLSSGAYREISGEPLGWATVGSRSQTDIFPKTNRLLDVCRFVKLPSHQQIQIPTRLGWQHLLVILKPKTYRITVTVSTLEGLSKTEKFTLLSNGEDVSLDRGWLDPSSSSQT